MYFYSFATIARTTEYKMTREMFDINLFVYKK